MGSWGPGLFENDSAMDFIGVDLNNFGALHALVAALALVATPGHGKNFSRFAEAFAAAEVLAVLLMHPMKDLPDEVMTLEVRDIPPNHIGSETVTLALQAIDAYYLYQDGEDFWAGGLPSTFSEQWELNIIDLERRLVKAKKDRIQGQVIVGDSFVE